MLYKTGLCGCVQWARKRSVSTVQRVWPSWPWPQIRCQRWGWPQGLGQGALTKQKIFQSSPWSRCTRLPSPQAGRRRRRPRCVCALHLSTAKPLGIYLSLSVFGCARLCLCTLPAVCLRLSLSLSGPLSQGACWSVPSHMAVGLCAYIYLRLRGTMCPCCVPGSAGPWALQGSLFGDLWVTVALW